MKFTINKDEFLKALLNSSKIIQSKNTDAILNMLKLEIFDDRLEITGSNGEITIKSIIPRYKDDKTLIRDIQIGGILINAHMITEIIRRIDGDEVNFIVEDNSLAKIQNLKSNFNLNVTRVEEYRDIDFDENGTHLILNRNDFVLAISQTSFASSIKENRDVLKCVNIESDGNEIIFTATDGARLARRIINNSENGQTFNVNVPAKTINEVVKSLTDETEIELYINENKVLFKLNNCVIIMTIVLGSYPNTRNIIPHNYYYRLEVNTQDFLKALDRVVLLSIDRENIVKLTMNEEEVTVSSRSPQIGDAIELLQIYKYQGERLEISFNVEYVSQAIRVLKSEEVILSFLGEMKPFTITSKNDDKVIQLVTPVRTF